MLKPEFTGQFKRDYKRAIKEGVIRRNWKKSFRFCVVRSLCRQYIETMTLQIREIIRI